MNRVKAALTAMQTSLDRLRAGVVSSFASFAWVERDAQDPSEQASDDAGAARFLAESRILATDVAGYIRLVYSRPQEEEPSTVLLEASPAAETVDPASPETGESGGERGGDGAPAWPTPFSDLPSEDTLPDLVEETVELTCSAWDSASELAQAWMAIPEFPEDESHGLGVELLGTFRVELLDREGAVVQRRAVSTRVSELMLGRPALLAVAMELSTFDRRNQLEAAYSRSAAWSGQGEEGAALDASEDEAFPKPAWDAQTRAKAISRRS